MRDRIEHILRAQNMTAAEFADRLGIQASGLSHILSGRNNPSLDFVMKLKNAFPEYNFDWLLLGVGPMTSYEQPISLQQSQSGQQEEVQKTPITPQMSMTFDDVATETAPKEVADTNKVELKKIIMVYSDDTFEVLEPHG